MFVIYTYLCFYKRIYLLLRYENKALRNKKKTIFRFFSMSIFLLLLGTDGLHLIKLLEWDGERGEIHDIIIYIGKLTFTYQIKFSYEFYLYI